MLSDFTADGTITEDGTLKLNDRAEFAKAMRTFHRGRVLVKVQMDRPRRSNRANRYYRGCVLKLFAEYTGDDPNELHEALKRKFTEPIRKVVMGVEILIWSTKENDSQEFYDFVQAVRRLAAENGVDTPEADPHFRFARKKETESVLDRRRIAGRAGSAGGAVDAGDRAAVVGRADLPGPATAGPLAARA